MRFEENNCYPCLFTSVTINECNLSSWIRVYKRITTISLVNEKQTIFHQFTKAYTHKRLHICEISNMGMSGKNGKRNIVWKPHGGQRLELVCSGLEILNLSTTKVNVEIVSIFSAIKIGLVTIL